MLLCQASVNSFVFSDRNTYVFARSRLSSKKMAADRDEGRSASPGGSDPSSWRRCTASEAVGRARRSPGHQAHAKEQSPWNAAVRKAEHVRDEISASAERGGL